MPYALLPTSGRLFVGLADGRLWESRDHGDSWTELRIDGVGPRALVALAQAAGWSERRAIWSLRLLG
jgi:hypothetical protein